MVDTKELLQNMRYSYSSVSSYENCPLGFKYNYIDNEWGTDNAFGQIGSLIHNTCEKYFRYELDAMDLPSYLKQEFSNIVSEDFPSFPRGMADNYYNFSVNFFENWDFERDDYEILMIEDKIDAEIGDIKLVVKPDLLLKHKKTGRVILIDYKSSNIYKGKKLDESKMAGYRKQLTLYAAFIEKVREIKVDKILIWAVRDNKFERIEYNEEIAQNTIDWFTSVIGKIRNETEWKDGGSPYFCANICNFRMLPCPFKKG